MFWIEPNDARPLKFTFEEQRRRLIDYLLVKLDAGDWHGVRDVAVDIEILEACNRCHSTIP